MLAINTPKHKLAKFTVTTLKSLTSNQYTVKDTFIFTEEIAEQDFESFMANRDVYSLFTDIPLEETLDICANTIFENTERVEGISKTECKNSLSLSTKESYFAFNGKLYKQAD